MTIHLRYSPDPEEGIKVAYVSDKPEDPDFRIRLALGMGMFPEAAPVIKNLREADRYLICIIEQNKDERIYFSRNICVAETTCTVILPKWQNKAYIGIHSKAAVSSERLEKLIEEVLIPMSLEEAGLIPIPSTEKEIPKILLNFNKDSEK